MPGFTVNPSSSQDSPSLNASNPLCKEVSRQAVIDGGVRTLQELGADSICKVCISYGGSCCQGCRHLADGIGCQQRNTSCTAWLCGYLKFLLYETELLQEWNDFWEQVPGQDFREDFTPEVFFINKSLSLPSIRKLGEALAADLQELAQSHIAIGFILTLREKIDKNIDELNNCAHNPKKQMRIKRNIRALSSPFLRFQIELHHYRNAK
jgi:hypothetical protein